MGLYKDRGFNPQNLIRASANFTRPADTTAYASGDLVANNTAAASVVPLSWTAARTVTGLFQVRAALMRKSDAGVTNAQFRLHLFSATPTIATTGDNGVFASVVTGYTTHLGFIPITVAQVFAAGSTGRGVPNEGQEILAVAGAGRLLYGLLEARAAWTPTSAEVLTVDLELVRA